MSVRTAIRLTALDTPPDGLFQAIYDGLHQASVAVVGPVRPRLLLVPLHDDREVIVGGLWGTTLLSWTQIDMLFVPEALRGCGYGSDLVAVAEAEARARGCRDMLVETFSFQAGPFYEKLGFRRFGVLDELPPGHRRLYYRKRLGGFS